MKAFSSKKEFLRNLTKAKKKIRKLKKLEKIYQRSYQTLQESEDYLKAILSALQETIIMVSDRNLKYTHIWLNPKLARRYGMQAKDMIGKTFKHFIRREDVRTAISTLKNVVINQGNPYRIEYEHILPRGKFWFDVSYVPLKDKEGKVTHVVSFIRDVTETANIMRALKQSEKKYRKTINSMSDAIHLIDRDFKIVLFNKTFRDWNEKLGLKTKVEGQILFKVFPFLPPRVKEEYNEVFKTKRALITEESTVLNERELITETRKIPVIEEGRVANIVTIVRNITERKNMEDALKENVKFYRNFLETSPDALILVDEKADIIMANKQAAKLYGVSSPGELLGKNAFHLIAPEDRERARKNMAITVKKNIVKEIEYTLLKKDGTPYQATLSASVLKDDTGNPRAFFGILRDITEKKKAERLLIESEARKNALLQAIPDLMFVYNKDGVFVEFKEARKQDLALKPAEIIGKNLRDVGFSPYYLNLIFHHTKQAFMTRKIQTFEYELELPKGKGIYEGRLIALNDNEILAIIRDITRRKKAENILHQRLDFEQTISTISSRFVGIYDLNEAINRSLADIGRLSHAGRVYLFLIHKNGKYMDNTHEWVEKGVPPKIDSFKNLSTKKFPWWIKMLNKGEIIRIDDVSKLPKVASAEKKFLQSRGIKSVLVLPLIVNAKLLGFMGFDKMKTEKWGNEDITLLRVFNEILENAFERKRAEEELEFSLRRLNKVMEEIIQAIAMTVETRDLYTAGHQRRVAKLATAIATQMDLSDNQVQAIHMAAVIHDIGKIQVPAEILSKPGRLNEVEYNIIKNHPQVSYDILKTIEFPWPVATIVLQHHERMNGSGYPLGLEGKKILLAARVLAVADVVEAMASHRPYRQALGIDKALAEIKKNRGVLYDPVVVDACLKLFKNKKFQFE
ncbi:MAG: PAS domain S-box protein [Spirochaetes bacterium]|nr:PAS domain S-box protein [Spirochaetota bacterium]